VSGDRSDLLGGTVSVFVFPANAEGKLDVDLTGKPGRVATDCPESYPLDGLGEGYVPRSSLMEYHSTVASESEKDACLGPCSGAFPGGGGRRAWGTKECRVGSRAVPTSSDGFAAFDVALELLN
jgi:hypothetical protein